MFKQATRQQSRLRMTIDGPAGGGKTYSTLRLSHLLADGGKIAVIDTERGSASKYVGEAPDGVPWAFDVAEMTTFSPSAYVDAIVAASYAGYAVLVIDSLSHAWEGKGGALEMKDKAADAQRTRNDYTAWRTVSPEHNRMVDAILQSPCHVITTMRSRMEYVQEKTVNERGQEKTTVRKVGLSPIQRPGMEYEFDVVADVDIDHTVRISKSRCAAMADAQANKPGYGFWMPLVTWLKSGSDEAMREVEKTREKARVAKAMRAEGKTMPEIIQALGVDMKQVLAWVA